MRRLRSSSIKSRGAVFLLLVICVFGPPVQARYSGGDGSAGNPYQIATPEDLDSIGNNPGDWSKSFLLINDIEMSAYSGTQFDIIGRRLSHNPYAIAIDSNDQKIYWPDWSLKKIRRINLDGANIEDLVTSTQGLSGPWGLALDVADEKIYWTDKGNDKIQRANLDGSLIEDLITSGLSAPTSIAIDPNGGKMYWVDYGNERIQRANLDGSVVEDVLPSEIADPYIIALDVNQQKIYWTDPANDKIQRANFDGSSLEDVIDSNLSNPRGLTLDVINGKMYWYDSGTIYRSDLVGSNIEPVIDEGLYYAHGIAVDSINGQIFWTNCVSEDSKVAVSDLNGTNTKTLVGNWFSGVFDGNNHTIENFTYTTMNDYEIGLFGDCRGQLKNINMQNVYVSDPLGIAIGGLAGAARGVITNCQASGFVRGEWGTGGLIGRIGSGTIVQECFSETETRGYGGTGGLVGQNYSGTIRNCHTNSSVYGTTRQGGLAGSNDGTIESCYSYGSVQGYSGRTGGFVGLNSQHIKNCYSFADVDSSGEAGGFVGDNGANGSIFNCYSTGQVTGPDQVGGFVGENTGAVISSYWDTQTSGITTSSGGTGKNTQQMMEYDTYVGWGCDNEWTINGGNDYPRLIWENQAGIMLGRPSYGGGSGTNEDPYLIYTKKDLLSLGCTYCDWDKNFKLMNDIDLSLPSVISFNPIGVPFSGQFDGQGYIISNLDYEDSPGNSIRSFGLFKHINGNEAQVSNLIIVDPNIILHNSRHTGSIAGQLLNGLLINCHVIGGQIIGVENVGGMVGENSGTITNCTVLSNVEGDYSVGGLAGSNYSKITCSDSESTVTGEEFVGGLVGYNYGDIYSSSAVCQIFATYVAGGIAGASVADYDRPAHVLIKDCYARGSVQAIDMVGGFIGSISIEIPYSINIENSYTACQVMGFGTQGAFIGGLQGDEAFQTIACVWDANINDPGLSGIGNGTDPCGLLSRPTLSMYTKDIYYDLGWDFVGEVINGPNDIWDICEGTNYPKFVWQIPAADFVCPDGVNFIDYAFFAEHWLQSIYGDCGEVELTGDGKVNWVDFALFAEYWKLTGCGECGGTDFTGDENVDLADLSVFATYWLGFEYAEVDLTNDGQVDLDDLREFTEIWLTGM